MNLLRRAGGLAGAVGLAGAALLHVYWLGGGRRAKANVVPVTDGRPAFRPGPVSTAGVAVALATASALYTGAALRWSPRWIHRGGAMAAATVLAARAIGDRRHLGFLKTERGTPFAHLDTRVLSPVCASLAVAGILAVSTSG